MINLFLFCLSTFSSFSGRSLSHVFEHVRDESKCQAFSATNSTNFHELIFTNCELQTANWKLRTEDCQVRTAKLPTANCELETVFHDIHVSMCELRYKEETSSFEVSLKIFIDDLEVGIKKEGYAPLNLETNKENEIAEGHLASYLDKYFTIEIDGKKLTQQFVGEEISEDYQAIWCYIEYPDQITNPKKCLLTNRILLDVFSDQRNIMDIKMNKSHSAYTILDPDHPTWSYNY